MTAWLHVHYFSEILGMPVPMEVLLPQHVSGRSRRTDDPGPYQTLYLLHGKRDDHTAWMRRTSIERYVEGLPLAVVMPAAHLSFYTTMAYGKDYFSFITEELPAICERMFPLSRRKHDRFIAGLSMGGYGAIKAGLLAPDTYSAVASFSGAFDVMSLYDRLDEQLATDVFGSKQQLKDSVNNPFVAAELIASSEKKCPDLYMCCGTEDFLYPENIRFNDRLSKLGLPITFEGGPGDHNWEYWDACIKRALTWLPIRESIEKVKE